MKVGRILFVAVLVGCLGVLGCGDDETTGTGGAPGSGGTGGTTTGVECGDADTICAGCAEGPALSDCRSDVLGCNTLSETEAECLACLETNPPGCD